MMTSVQHCLTHCIICAGLKSNSTIRSFTESTFDRFKITSGPNLPCFLEAYSEPEAGFLAYPKLWFSSLQEIKRYIKWLVMVLLHCRVTSPGSLLRSWIWVTVYVEFCMCRLGQHWFPPGSPVSSHLPKTIGGLEVVWLCLISPKIIVWMCEHGALWCVPFRVCSCPAPSVPGIGSGLTATLSKIKRLLMINDRMNYLSFTVLSIHHQAV